MVFSSITLVKSRNLWQDTLMRRRVNYRKRGSIAGFLKKLIANLFLLAVMGLVFVIAAFLYYAKQVPDPSVISERRVTESTKIYDRTGTVLLYDVHGEEKRTIIPWDQIPQSVRNATLASEDSEFYQHSGLDLKGILRALYKDVVSLDISQGGSTITQQLIKKALLSDERTLPRKIKEAILSIQLEKRYSKDEILWMYLNQIPYGSNAYGIEAASQTYFDKSAEDLTVAESALLASMIKAPSYFSPYGNHVDELLGRRDFVLERMKNLGYINEDEFESAKKEKHTFKRVQDNIIAPHFVIMVRDYLNKKYGEDAVQNDGLRVVTTLDAELQKSAEETVAKYGDINAAKYKATNAALVAVDPKTGQILSMVGSRDYFNLENEGNFNVATALRQPGSSFKPIAYAKALEKGYSDSTVVMDVRTEFNPACNPSGFQTVGYDGTKCYHPQNYDGQFRGAVTLRQGLAQSLNIPSVKVLSMAGVSDTIDLARAMGITSLTDKSRYGLALVLGGGEVKLVEMVSAYSVFANDGNKSDSSFILKVVQGNGKVLEEYKSNETRVMDAQVARTISDMLSDNNARGPVFGYNSPLNIAGKQVAAKTGTTQENRDAWVVGYTPAIAVGVWVGNNNNTPMTQQGAGISAAGPLWHEFMNLAITKIPGGQFIKPDPTSPAEPASDSEQLFN